ncbi:type I pullulanase [Ferruginibacter sp.]|nr:type I pullulanase [Ferruginibacter sp.]
MKRIFILLLCFVTMKKITAQPDFNTYPVYRGTDLGLSYSKTASSFRIWSPTAIAAELILYKDGSNAGPLKTVQLTKGLNGTWFTKLSGDWKGTFYTFRVNINNTWSNELPDPYAKAVGVNGKRAMIINLKETNPAGWAADKSPAFSTSNKAMDAVIYELHVRDASIDENSGIKNKGKFLGLTEPGTKNKEGLSTGLDHIKTLGVTHIHLLPFFDYNSVDESQPAKQQYNWGYDPLNFNAPEGSYSTDPYNGATRINELKQLVAAFHKNGLRVVMDVVYNHVADAKSSNFNQLVPGYYFRHKKDGSFSDATACGNETASELPMMRKFILESVLYWVKEYHIDGFRFDLMGVHDIETMNIISDELHKIKPDILLYGEGWTAGASPIPDAERALKKNAAKLRKIAVFSDDVRDGIKGSVFEIKDRGFASSKKGMEESVKFGIVAASNHPQVDLSKVNYSKEAYSKAPWNVITYSECHDNNTLWDKLSLSSPEASREDITKMHQLSLAIVLTSQGIPFLHAGTELLRDKKGVENSYNAGDSINKINWSCKSKNISTFNLVQQLIKMRKSHPAFRMTTNQLMSKNISFSEDAPAGVIAYTINGAAVKDSWKNIFVVFNGNAESKETSLPKGKWNIAVDTNNDVKISSGTISLQKYSAVVLYR